MCLLLSSKKVKLIKIIKQTLEVALLLQVGLLKLLLDALFLLRRKDFCFVLLYSRCYEALSVFASYLWLRYGTRSIYCLLKFIS